MHRPAPVRIARALVAGAVAHAAAQTAAAPAAAAQRVPPPSLNAAPAVGPYERARRLVEQGQGAVGRAVADSLVAASPPGSPALAEALWWRATLSADGARAEQDLRRIIDDFSASPRVGDATVRIAQLDISRDRPDMAAPALDRLVRERPDDPARAQAAYWLARARLELGDVRGACFALADGTTWARSSETFTRQQLVELRERLPACDPQSVVSVMPGAARRSSGEPSASAPPTRQVAQAPSSQPPEPRADPRMEPRIERQPEPRTSEPATISSPPPSVAATSPVATRPAANPPATNPPAATPPVTSPPITSRPAASVVATRPTTAGATTPAATSMATSTAAAPTVAAATRTPPTAPAAESGGNFAVQVAAYAQRDGADALAARLRARGLDARATGQVAPFRVKIGRYATRSAAAAARATFAGQGFAGFVTDAGDGPPGVSPGASARRP